MSSYLTRSGGRGHGRFPCFARTAFAFVLVLAISPPAFAEGVDSILGDPPGEYRVTSPDGSIKIPFELYRDDIRMLCRIKGKETRMLLDNGSLWDQLLFFGSPRVDSLGFLRTGKIEVRGAGGGDPIYSDTAEGIKLVFPGVEFRRQTAVITPYDPALPNPWEGAEGQVSAAFFKNFVVEVNFDEMVITLTEPGRFHPQGKGEELPLRPLGGGGWMIPASVRLDGGRRLDVDLALDLGTGDALALSTGGPHGFTVPRHALPASLGFGIQGEIHGHVGRVPVLSIGGCSFRDVLATFAPREQSGFPDADIVLGMGIFSRLNVVFDYPGRRMFIRPGRRYQDPFEYNMSGMELGNRKEGGLVVTRIIPHSPASDAGLRLGDLIERIDGAPASRFRSWELGALLRRPGAEVSLEIQRDGETRELSLRLRRII